MKEYTSLEPELRNEFGRITRAPPFTPDESIASETMSSAEREELLAMDKAELVDEILNARKRLAMWERSAADLVSALALAPDANSLYARLLRQLLSKALNELDAVDEVRHVECSMPSLPAEKPSIALVTWHSLAYSEWDVTWYPASWWVSVSAVGFRWGLSFNVLTECSDIFVRGRLRCAFSKDMTSLRVSFVEEPSLEMSVQSSVGWGAVPVPVREQIETIVRAEIHRFVSERLVGDESLLLVLRRKALEPVSDEDLEEARAAARRANSVQLRPPSILL